ncbi:MAG: hypothetical protein LC799_24670 [Actinobacteria bacterium]|nr:hypothetical protein [Actinomycetota bacterium]
MALAPPHSDAAGALDTDGRRGRLPAEGILAARRCWTTVDVDAGTLSIEGTVIRIPGEGLIVQPHTKSKAGMHTIRPPAWVLDVFRRHVDEPGKWIFPTTRQFDPQDDRTTNLGLHHNRHQHWPRRAHHSLVATGDTQPLTQVRAAFMGSRCCSRRWR